MGLIINDPEVVLRLARATLSRNMIEYIESGQYNFAKFKRLNLHVVTDPDLTIAQRQECFKEAKDLLEVVRNARRGAAQKAQKEALRCFRAEQTKAIHS